MVRLCGGTHGLLWLRGGLSNNGGRTKTRENHDLKTVISNVQEFKYGRNISKQALLNKTNGRA